MVATDREIGQLSASHEATKASNPTAGKDGAAQQALCGGRAPTCTEADPVEQLANLDDAVFAAIAGRAEALDGLRRLWPEIKARLGTPLVEESRDQYVRYALRVWRASLAGDELRDPTAALAAIDVMSLLFDE
ncbi:MAG: hypothetical protein ABUL64_01015 [Singulisphaera sp.]